MDADFWASRIHKHIPSVQSARLGNSGGSNIMMEDEGGDEVRAWFPCPFCYVEIEVPMLCIHLQEEHCFDLKNAVCPICAANLGRDPLAHFTLQHAHSIKRRKQSQKPGIWSHISTTKDFREPSSFLCAPDPLLSPFLCTAPLTVGKDGQKDQNSCAAATRDAGRCSKPSCVDEAEGRDHKEMRQRAAFVQELLYSTIF
ncbi:hypothetical protein ACS0TY_034907 [Phlomoides rotata]